MLLLLPLLATSCMTSPLCARTTASICCSDTSSPLPLRFNAARRQGSRGHAAPSLSGGCEQGVTPYDTQDDGVEGSSGGGGGIAATVAMLHAHCTAPLAQSTVYASCRGCCCCYSALTIEEHLR